MFKSNSEEEEYFDGDLQTRLPRSSFSIFFVERVTRINQCDERVECFIYISGCINAFSKFRIDIVDHAEILMLVLST